MSNEPAQIHVSSAELAGLRAQAHAERTTINKLINAVTIEYLNSLGVR